MKVLITGAGGQLGQEFQRLFEKLGIEHILTYSKRGPVALDITDFKSLREFIKNVKPDVIINCAAYNAVDKAEEEWKLAYNVNGLGVRNLSICANEVGAFLVHYSTNYVFDGEKKAPYTIYDNPNPISKYGESKYLGEKMIKSFCNNYALIRTSWVFGTGNNNFIMKILELSRNSEKISLVIDEISAPTYTVDLAFATFKIIQERVAGIYHISNEGEISRYDLGKYVLDKIKWHGQINTAFQKDFNLPAKRPKYSKLDSFGLKESVGIEMPYWEDAVDRFLRELEILG